MTIQDTEVNVEKECMTVLESHEYTHIVTVIQGEATENSFSFPGATVCFTFNQSQAWELPVGCWPQSSMPCSRANNAADGGKGNVSHLHRHLTGWSRD